MKKFNKKSAGLALVFAMTAAMLAGCGSSAGGKSTADGNGAETAVGGTGAETAADGTVVEEETGLEFPYELDEGKISVTSVFTSDIANPDAANAEGTDIASVEIKNQSDEMLTEGTVSVLMFDGTSVEFHIEDLPAGESMWAFAEDNTQLENSAECMEISAKDEYASEDPLKSDQFKISAAGTEVTITNISGEEQKDITIYCHCLMGDTIFGGLVYSYSVGDLGAGDSAVVSADDCILGEAEAVRIENGNQS